MPETTVQAIVLRRRDSGEGPGQTCSEGASQVTGKGDEGSGQASGHGQIAGEEALTRAAHRLADVGAVIRVVPTAPSPHVIGERAGVRGPLPAWRGEGTCLR